MLVPFGPSILGNERLRFLLDQIDLNRPVKVKSKQFIAEYGRPKWGQHPNNKSPVPIIVPTFPTETYNLVNRVLRYIFQ